MLVTKIKIKGVPSENIYNTLPFGRKLDYKNVIEQFKGSAKQVWLSQKRKTFKKALREFMAINNVVEYYTTFHSGPGDHDDTFLVYYKEGEIR